MAGFPRAAGAGHRSVLLLLIGAVAAATPVLAATNPKRPKEVHSHARPAHVRTPSTATIASSSRGTARDVRGRKPHSQLEQAASARKADASKRRLLSARTTPQLPEVENYGFEGASTKIKRKVAKTGYYYFKRREMKGWFAKAGYWTPGCHSNGVLAVTNNVSNFQFANTSDGQYFVALSCEGSYIETRNGIEGHVAGQRYRLVFHAALRHLYGEAMLAVKLNGWTFANDTVVDDNMEYGLRQYELPYTANGSTIDLTFIHAGPKNEETAIFIDAVNVTMVIPWQNTSTKKHIFMQKIVCPPEVDGQTVHPSEEICHHGPFLTAPDPSYDGEMDSPAKVHFTPWASKMSVWEVDTETNPKGFVFKSFGLASYAGLIGSETYFLHNVYGGQTAEGSTVELCEVARASELVDHEKNFMLQGNWSMRTNLIGWHEISNTGTECGSWYFFHEVDIERFNEFPA